MGRVCFDSALSTLRPLWDSLLEHSHLVSPLCIFSPAQVRGFVYCWTAAPVILQHCLYGLGFLREPQCSNTWRAMGSSSLLRSVLQLNFIFICNSLWAKDVNSLLIMTTRKRNIFLLVYKMMVYFCWLQWTFSHLQKLIFSKNCATTLTIAADIAWTFET